MRLSTPVEIMKAFKGSSNVTMMVNERLMALCVRIHEP